MTHGQIVPHEAQIL